MKLIHITDIHLSHEGTEVLGSDPGRNLAQCLAHVSANHADAALCVVTGDLAHWGERAAYDHLRARLDGFPLPVRLMIGNHDDRATFLDAFPESPVDPNGYVQWSEETGAGRFLYLDTVEPLTHAGHYGPDRQAWLRAELAAAGETPCYLFMHHNPMPIGIAAPDAIGLTDTGPFRQILREHAGIVRHVFFGHCHMPMSGTIEGIPFASLRGTNHHSWQDFSGGAKLKQADLTPLYNVVLIDGATCVVHSIDYSYDGPLREFGTSFEDWAERAEEQGVEVRTVA